LVGLKEIRMQKSWALMGGVMIVAVAVGVANAQSARNSQSATACGRFDVSCTRIPDSRVKQGFDIAPVPLNLSHKNRSRVGLGSYLVNAVAGCSDCHTFPTYTPTGNPFNGQPKQINTANYLAGGACFGPIISANITPDSNGRPAGLTRDQFVTVMRTGQNPSDPTGPPLQVMPWPDFQGMTTADLNAIYEYLRAIPSASPSNTTCP
jgi:hypothetical protein